MIGLHKRPGEDLTADELNRLGALLSPATGMLLGGFGSSGGFGVTMPPDVYDPQLVRQQFVGRIVSGGPNGEADFTDARYWVREVRLTDDSTRLKFFGEADFPNTSRRWVEATNLAESRQGDRASESHALGAYSTPDNAMLVVARLDFQPDRTARWYFTAGGDGAIADFAVQSHADEWLVCRSWDGQNQGAIDIYVLKPAELRRSTFDGKDHTVGGRTLRYEYLSPHERNAIRNSDGFTERQVIVPWFACASDGGSPGTAGPSIIHGMPTADVVNGQAVSALMVAPARAWAKKKT